MTRGSLSSLSVPLPLTGLAGALNIYATDTDGFDESASTAAQGFAGAATAAIGNMHAYQGAQDVIANLTLALDSRAVIDQAKGILMERRQLTADQAFGLLTAVSQRANVKVRAVAEHLLRTGELLDPPDRPRPGRRTRT